MARCFYRVSLAEMTRYARRAPIWHLFGTYLAPPRRDASSLYEKSMFRYTSVARFQAGCDQESGDPS